MNKHLSKVFSWLTVLALMLMAAPKQSAQAGPTELFFSEYIEGTSFNKALEIYNGTGAAVDLASGGYTIQMYFNGSVTAGTTLSLSGAVADGDAYVIANSSSSTPSDPAILAQADFVSLASFYNGDDAVALLKNGVIIDVIGQIGSDPGSEWGTGLVSTQDNTLRRKANICSGDTDGSNAFEPSVEWDGFATNTFDGLGSHSANCGGPTNPTGIGSADPSLLALNESTLLTVAVTPGTNPPSTGLAVSCDLSPIGGSETQMFFDNGTNGDATAGDNIFSFLATVGAGTSLSLNSLPCTINDAELRTGSASISLSMILPISTIQGSGDTSTAGTFTVEAIVVGDYQTQGSGQLRGFFLQEEDADADADPATSEGIFVFCSGCPTPVSVGDKVRVTGASSEFFGMSQLSATTAASVSVLSSGNPLPTPASVQLPVPSVPSGDLTAATAAINAYFEASEGMLVTFPDTLSVSEYFELARYGQVVLTEGGRPRQFTDANTPTVAGFINHEVDLASRTIILDDTDNRQNRPVDTPNTAYYHPVPGLSTGNFFRGGDTITNLTGVLHWSFAGQSGTDAWRIRPVTEAYSYAFTPVNPRPAPPSLGGNLKVTSFNVLNYFLTVDTTASNNVGTCGPSGNLDCRGADSAQELERQRAKLLSALQGLDADVIGLIEMENTTGVEPLADIVAGLPGYAYIDTGVIGTDAIRVGLIYKTATVLPVGPYAILDSTVDPRFIDTLNRPALAQTFEEIANGARFTVVVNHLKSKGSGCGVGDDDTTTGQGNCNGTRTLAALALADWLATDPTSSSDPDVLIIGDLNSYAKEDPIDALEGADYTNLVAAFGGSDAYSYVFDGQLGYLDHALSNATLTPQVTGVAEWHINADEIPLFDYNDDVRDTGEASFEEESDTFPLYEANAFRTSDHDPVIVGLCQPPSLEVSVSPDTLWPANHKYVTVQATFVVSADTSSVALLSVTSNEPDNGDDDGDTINDIVIFDDLSFDLRAERSGIGTGRVYTITYQATNTCGNSTIEYATVTVPLSQGK